MGIKQVYGFDIRQGFGQSFLGNFIETEFYFFFFFLFSGEFEEEIVLNCVRL